MSRDALRDRFSVKDFDGSVISRHAQRRQAIDRARQEARKKGFEIEIVDTMASVGAVLSWVVHPSGIVAAVELRSVEAQAGGQT